MMIDPPAKKSTLALLFPSPAMARLVIFFSVHPGGRFHLRDLMRRTGLSSASLQNELRRMTEIGALRREDDGARTYYVADQEHPSWRAWVLLLRASASPSDVLREALIDADGIEAAFIFGSQARGDTRPDSDVDLFLIGSEEAQEEVGERLLEARFLLGSELDVIGYDEEQLAARFQSGSSFMQAVLTEPKEWLRGGPDALDPVAARARSVVGFREHTYEEIRESVHPQLRMMLDARKVEIRAGGDDEVIRTWERAISTLRCSLLPDLSTAGAFTLSYEAALQAAAAVVRSAGYRVRGGAHQQTFETVIALELDADLSAVSGDLNVLRQKRHAAVYEWEARIEEKDLGEMRSTAERIFIAARRWLLSERPHIAASLPSS